MIYVIRVVYFNICTKYMCCISRVRVCGIFFFLICSLILKYFYELCTHIIFFKRETKDAEHVFLFLHHSLSTLSFSLNHFPISLCLSNTHTHTHTYTHTHTHTHENKTGIIYIIFTMDFYNGTALSTVSSSGANAPSCTVVSSISVVNKDPPLLESTTSP